MSPCAIVLVHYGDPALTAAGLRNLLAVEGPHPRVVVVDHGPAPGLGHSLAGLHPNLTVVTNHANPGFGAGCNLGAAHAFEAGAEAVWFLNNDARLEEPVLARLLDQAGRHPEVALWGTHQVEHGRRLGADVHPGWFAVGAKPVAVAGLEGGRVLGGRESLSGASLLVTRAAWERLGPWPETQFLYYEDAAWCRRAHGLGLPIVLLEVAVLHPRGSTTGRHSAFTTFYGTRNRLRLRAETAGTATLLREGAYLLQRRLFRGQWSLLRPTWRALWAALTGLEGRDPRY